MFRRFKIIFFSWFILFGCSQNNTNCEKGKEEYNNLNYLGAIYYFDKCLKSGDSLNAEILSLRGSSYQHVGKLEFALKDFQQSLAIRPNNINTLLNIGDILFKLDSVAQGCDYTSRAYLADSTFPEINYNMGVCSFEHGDYNKAIYYLKKELIKYPDSYKAIFLKAHSLLMLGQVDLCLQEVERGMKIKKYSLGYFIRGMAWFEKEEYEKALNDYNQAILLDNTNPEYYMKKASTLGLLKRYDESIEACNAALTHFHNYANAYYLKATTYYIIDNYDSACLNYFKALQLDSTFNNQDLNDYCIR